MTDPTKIGELAGWCGACRVIWTWYGKPLQQDAACPQCLLPLARKPRRCVGRHRVENRRPSLRERPVLVVREVDDTQPQKDIA